MIWSILASKAEAQARLSLHLSKCHIARNLMSRLICDFRKREDDEEEDDRSTSTGSSTCDMSDRSSSRDSSVSSPGLSLFTTVQ